MIKIRKWLRRVIARHFASAIMLTLTASPAAAAGEPSAPAATPERTLDPSDVRADFKQLYAGLQEAHFNLYARVSKQAYDRLYRQMLGEFTVPLSPLEAASRFQRFAAFGRVAHSRIDTAYGAFEQHMAGGGKALPFALRIVRSRVFVAQNKSGLPAIRPGDEITALDGRPIAWWLAHCARNVSADNRYMAESLMELDLPMLLWLEAGPAERFDLRLRRPNGQQLHLTVPTRTRADMKRFAAGQPAGLNLAQTDRSWRMLDASIGYLRPGGFYNTDPGAADMYDNKAFGRFIDTAFEGLIAKGAKSLIIDIRDNPGGDSSFSDLMVSWFASKPYRFNSAFLIKVSPEAVESNAARLPLSPPGSISHQFAALYAAARPGDVVHFDTPPTFPRTGPRYTGRVYLLINRNSYSNTVAVAATIQDYRFGAILGEETSDLATTYGAMETFTLPRTGLKVGFPKARIVRPSGELVPRGVRPDISIETPILESPQDPVLQRAAAIIRARPPSR